MNSGPKGKLQRLELPLLGDGVSSRRRLHDSVDEERHLSGKGSQILYG